MNDRSAASPSEKRGLALRGVQWPEFQHGIETWLLWSNGKKHRVEKLDGKWTPEELGLVVDTSGR